MLKRTVRCAIQLLAIAGLITLASTGDGAAPLAPARARAQVTPTYFVEDQVIVTGRIKEINQVIKEVIANGIGLDLIERADLSYTQLLPSFAPFPFPPSRAELVMDLYRITTSAQPVDAVIAINRTALDLGLNVHADPNYVTGRPPALASGDPWSGGGSPAGASAAAAAELFWGQWAFGSRGIGLRAEGGPAGSRSVPFTGKGARVGVFDTSPFRLNRGVVSQLTAVDWISPTLNLMVSHPSPAAQLDPPNPAIDVRDHGLFVAGLIHAVAPQSNISLTRVLDEYGQGDLYTLNREVHRFISDTVDLGPAFLGTVINLSLGVHPPPNAAELHLPAEIVSLQTALQAADGFKLVVVAAAGNDGNAKQMQIPAQSTTVIGVAASDAQRGRGCFSNRGDLGAPGGDGSAPGCTPTVDDCVATCAVAVVSLAMIGKPGADTGYAYWTGSSFAAPLASGVAALLLAAKGGGLTPAQVAQQIYDGALPPNLPPSDGTLGAGILNLRRTLLPFETRLPLSAVQP